MASLLDLKKQFTDFFAKASNLGTSFAKEVVNAPAQRGKTVSGGLDSVKSHFRGVIDKQWADRGFAPNSPEQQRFEMINDAATGASLASSAKWATKIKPFDLASKVSALKRPGIKLGEARFDKLKPDIRPAHQVAIEELMNKGDTKGAKALIDRLPNTDPYKKSMQGVVRFGKQTLPFTEARPGVFTKTPLDAPINTAQGGIFHNPFLNQKGGINLKAKIKLSDNQVAAIKRDQSAKAIKLNAHESMNEFLLSTKQGQELHKAFIKGDKATFQKIVNSLPEERKLELTNLISKSQPQVDQVVKSVGKINAPAGEQSAFSRFTTNAVSFPREVMATGDLSAGGRQGLLLAPTHPGAYAHAFKNQLKSIVSDANYQKVNAEIQKKPTYDLMQKSGLHLSDINSKNLTAREEMFQSQWGEKIPLLGKVFKASNRGYTNFLNTLRADVFDDLATKYKASGVSDAKVYDDLAKWVNSATGRGDMGRFENSTRVLSQGFFAPRLMAARFNYFDPRFYANLSPEVRKEAIKSALGLAGSVSLVLGLAKMANPDSVTGNMTSPDWGKIKVGNSRFDITGGHGSLVRLFAQLATGQTTSSTTGKTRDQDRLETLGKFFQNKESPVLGFVTGLATGKDTIGQEFEVEPKLVGMLHPLFWSDYHDLVQEHGAAKGTALSALPFLGFGQQTYGGDVSEAAPGLDETIVNSLTNGEGREFESSDDAPQNFFSRAGLYGQALVTDPGQTMYAATSPEVLRKIRGNAVILERELNLNPPGGTMQLDHTIPLSLGGINRKSVDDSSNLKYYPPAIKKQKDALEQKLYRKLESGEITREEAQRQALAWVEENGPGLAQDPTASQSRSAVVTTKSKQQPVLTQESGLQDIKYLNSSGKEAVFKLSEVPVKPQMTGQPTLDAKLTSRYNSALRSYGTTVTKAADMGLLDPVIAENVLKSIDSKLPPKKTSVIKTKKVSGVGKAKKPRKITIKTTSVNSFKTKALRVSKPKMIKLKKPKTITIKTSSGKYPAYKAKPFRNALTA